MAQIDLKGLRKSFGPTEVIPGLDLQVRGGEFMVFVGPSGCGKSTLLRMIAGLESVSAGEIHIAGVDVTQAAPSERGAAMVFQSYALYPHMTVEENMGFGLRISGTAKQQTQQQVQAIAEKLQLTPLLQRYPKQLSGGQRQRVAIGRAIVRRPQVFLFDEPLSNLDAALRVQMRIELAKLHADLKTTMIYVTHDQTEAMTLGNRIAVFNQGRIEQVGRPMDLYAAPSNTFVAQFLGTPKINLIPYAFDEQAGALRMGTGAWSPTAASAALLEKLRKGSTLGVRPESFVVSPSGLPGVVEFVENLGDASVVYTRLPGLNDLVTVKAAPRDLAQGAFERGDAVGLAPDPQHLLVFDRQGQLLA